MTDSAYARGISNALSERQTVLATALARLEERSNLLADIAALLVETLRAPVPETATVQELHMLFTHLIRDVAEAELYRDEPRPK